MAINKGYLTSGRTIESDEVYTPFYAVDPILEFLPMYKDNEEKNIYWLPFDEEWSAFYQTLKQKGYKVIRSCLSEGQDFFEYEPEKWDIVLSNPPFSKKDEVLKRLYELGKPFAILLPVNSIQGKKRFQVFKEDIQMLVFDVRVDYHTLQNFKTYTKGNHFGSAYFCRKLLPERLILRELNKYEKPLKNKTVKIINILKIKLKGEEKEWKNYISKEKNTQYKTKKLTLTERVK